MSEISLSRERILELFNALNLELEPENVVGELYLVGGAVMCLSFNERPSTKDVDAVFQPKEALRQAAVRVAESEGVSSDWLNDAVKGYLSPQGLFSLFLELSNLKVFAAQPEYLLAMKCLAMRLGAEFSDERDVRFLLRYLNIEKLDQALRTITPFYPAEKFPKKTLYALEELLS